MNSLNIKINKLIEEFLDASKSGESSKDSQTGPSNVEQFLSNKIDSPISTSGNLPNKETPNLGGSETQPVDRPEPGTSVIDFGTTTIGVPGKSTINDQIAGQKFSDRYKAIMGS